MIWYTRAMIWYTRAMIWYTRAYIWYTRAQIWYTRAHIWYTRAMIWFTRAMIWKYNLSINYAKHIVDCLYFFSIWFQKMVILKMKDSSAARDNTG